MQGMGPITEEHRKLLRQMVGADDNTSLKQDMDTWLSENKARQDQIEKEIYALEEEITELENRQQFLEVCKFMMHGFTG